MLRCTLTGCRGNTCARIQEYSSTQRFLAGSLYLLALTLCAMLLSFPQAAMAQAVNGTVVGTVTDASGGTVADAQVTITDPALGVSRSGKTDGSGNYVFPDLPPGNYTVKVQKEGFSAAQQEGIALQVNSTQRANLTLQTGQVTETVTV